MKVVKMALFLLAFAVSGTVFARTPEAVVNLVDQPVASASGKALTAEQVKQTIGKVAQDKKWIVTPMQNGKLNASLSWNGNKHTIVVEIACEADRYSVTYKDSVNMNYMVRDGAPVIHPFYNRHVNALRDAIRVEMMRM
jgi:hypothetical protein